MAVRPRPELDTSPAGPRKDEDDQEATAPVKKRAAKNKARSARVSEE